MTRGNLREAVLLAAFFVFLSLKLGRVVDWSWWWVTSPLWGPPALVLALFAVILAVAAVMATVVALTGCRR